MNITDTVSATHSQPSQTKERIRMLISCPDQPGIVAAVSRYLYERGANIVQSDQHTTDPENGMFFMRIEADFERYDPEQIEGDFATIAHAFDMEWRIERARYKKKMAIFVSKSDHCLLELLWQWRAGNLPVDVAFVASNHPDLRAVVEEMGLPYYHFPISATTKNEVEQAQLELIHAYEVDLIVLARYMQILTPRFTAAFPNRIINIHHSFLPAFIGANPYERAYQRGVKLIGATAHYVTDELDEGPIIEQDVQRVNHRDQVHDLKEIGKYIERIVLARAVRWHVEDRLLTYENKTIVFA